MQLPVAGLALGLMLAGCGAAPEPAVKDAWIRLPAVAGRPGAAYFTLSAGDAPLTLVAVRSPAAVRTELHESMSGAGGMTAMAPLRQVAVPAGSSVTFAPGGKHVMMFDINPALKSGGTTTLQLALADGKTLEARADLRGAGDLAP